MPDIVDSIEVGSSVLYLDGGREARSVVDAVANAGFDVTWVQSAEDAVDHLRGSHVDCVVSEYALPDADGIEFLRRVRSVDDVPVIVFTQAGDETVASETIAAGATHYVPKRPLEEGQSRLLDRLRTTVRADERATRSDPAAGADEDAAERATRRPTAAGAERPGPIGSCRRRSCPRISPAR